MVLNNLEEDINILTANIANVQQGFYELSLEIILQRIQELLCKIENMHEKLKNYIFKNVQDEILFFKVSKMNCVQELICLKWFVKYKSEIPWNTENKLKFLKKNKNKMNEFIQKHKEFFTYLKQGLTHNDKDYFTRVKHSNAPNQLYLINFDTCLSSTHGYLKAKLLAYEQLLFFIYQEISYLKKNKIENKNIKKNTLKWTKSKIDLVELIYAMHYMGCFNNGAGSVTEIAQCFDQLFDTDTSSQIHRDYIDIKRRKIEPTKFLNKMQQVFYAKIINDSSV